MERDNGSTALGSILISFAVSLLALGFAKDSSDKTEYLLNTLKKDVDEIKRELEMIDNDLDKLEELHSDIKFIEEEIYALNRGNIEEFRKRRRWRR